MKVGNKVKVIRGRTSSEYIGLEGIIDIVVETVDPRMRHVGINITKVTKTYKNNHTFIYCSDLKIIPKELSTNTRLM